MTRKTMVKFFDDGVADLTSRRRLGDSAGIVTGDLYIRLFGTPDQLLLYRQLKTLRSKRLRWVHNDGDAITLMKEPVDGDTRSISWYTANIANGTIKELFMQHLNNEELQLLNKYIHEE